MAKTILLADDSLVIQKLVGLSFANEDVELVTTDNGTEAIQIARAVHPHVVLADVVMPGLSGYEVCSAIKSDPATADIPVILLTRTSESYNEELAIQIGAKGHITKPFESGTLAAKIQEILEESPTAASSSQTAFPAQEFGERLDDYSLKSEGDTSVLAHTSNHELLVEPLTRDEFREQRDPEKTEGLTPFADDDWDLLLDGDPSPEAHLTSSSAQEGTWDGENTDAVIDALLQEETDSRPTQDSPSQITKRVERMASEAFSDLPEAVVKSIVERVEAIAWEVIPQMAEALIREEIRRMKGDPEESD